MNEANEQKIKISPAQWYLAALALACTAGGFMYNFLFFSRDGIFHIKSHSAALFVGIPSVLAIILALTPKAKSLIGGIVKGTTFALLVIAPLLGEGYLCILFAAPLFYIVGILVGVVVEWFQNRKSLSLSCLALILLPMSLEGVTPWLSFHRGQTVEVTRIVNASADAVQRQLALSPDVATRLPAALRIGFPVPLRASGSGLKMGDLRAIHFAGAEGDPPGDLTMRVAESRPGFARFETVSDTSKLTQWIAWDNSEVAWEPVDATHTRVLWRVRFQRQLDPAWYFAPLERAAVYEAADYLIRANATPNGSR